MGRLVVVGAVLTTLFSACGGAHPTAATPTTTAANALVTQRLDMAVAEQNKSENAAAVADFLAVVKLDPENKIAWYDLGLIAQQENQENQAISDYLHSLGGDPDYVPSLYNLAILETATSPSYAVGLYTRLLRLQPDDAAAHLNLGFVYMNENRAAQAKTQFSAAIRLDRALASRIPKLMGGTAS